MMRTMGINVSDICSLWLLDVLYGTRHDADELPQAPPNANFKFALQLMMLVVLAESGFMFLIMDNCFEEALLIDDERRSASPRGQELGQTDG
jgi:hypothetical protein